MSTIISEMTTAAHFTADFDLKDDEDDIDLEGILNGIFGSLMTLVTFAGQIIVFLVVSRDPRLRTPSNYFIISLAIADFSISIVSMPTWTVYSTLHRWPFSQALCDLWNVLDYILCMVSIYTILFMSIDRYLSLKYPFTYRLKRTKLRAKVALLLIWICTAIMYGTYIQTSQHLLGTDRDPNDCSTYYLTSIPLTTALVIMAHWTGVFGTAIVYVMVYKLAREAGRMNSQLGHERKGSVTKGSTEHQSKESNSNHSEVSASEEVTIEMQGSITSINGAHGTAGGDKTSNTKRMKNPVRNTRKDTKERKAMRTITLLLVTFAICWLPLSVIFMFEALKPAYLSPWWMIGGYWLGYVNSMLNPVCYAVGNPYFRETLSKLLSKK